MGNYGKAVQRQKHPGLLSINSSMAEDAEDGPEILSVAPEVDVSAIAIRPNGCNVSGELQCVIKYEIDQPLYDASWELKVQAADDARKLIQRVWQLLIDYA